MEQYDLEESSSFLDVFLGGGRGAEKQGGTKIQIIQMKMIQICNLTSKKGCSWHVILI